MKRKVNGGDGRWEMKTQDKTQTLRDERRMEVGWKTDGRCKQSETA